MTAHRVKTFPPMTIFGQTVTSTRLCTRGPICHRYEPSYPRRLVYTGTKGWNLCGLCGKEHRIWMTDDGVWDRLPYKQRGRRLCTGCFRRLVPDWRLVTFRP